MAQGCGKRGQVGRISCLIASFYAGLPVGIVALDFPDLPGLSDIASVDASTGPMPVNADFGKPSATVSAHCSPQNLARYPSGWPASLDWGIYWFGHNNQFKKAEPRQQVTLINPGTWFDHGDDYSNSTERWNSEFFDPSRNTVIYFHGWSGTGAWSTKECRRVTSKCDHKLCPKGEEQLLAEPWLKDGWNVGFFYWDQFADEKCIRDAEQKIWFDRKGNGLKWASYSPSNNILTWEEYRGEAQSITDMCVTAVKSAMGGFYSGKSVRFVGRSIGAQLAVACAARLHGEKHVVAPQRMTLLDPFFTQKEFSFFGTGIRCGRVTSSAGIEDFAQEASANYVKMLWRQHKVVTEVYSSAGDSSVGADNQADQDMRRYSLQVEYKPRWCSADDEMQCAHRAVFPLYFLSYGATPPPLVPQTGRGLDQVSSCLVPSAACTDSQVRALLAAHVTENLRVQSLSPGSVGKQVWQQVGGSDTFAVSDDTFAAVGGLAPNAADADPVIETEVAEDNALSQREWGMNRKWWLGPQSGVSSSQVEIVGQVVGVIVAAGLFACFAHRLCQRDWSSRSSKDESSDEEESDLDGMVDSAASPDSFSSSQKLMKDLP